MKLQRAFSLLFVSGMMMMVYVLIVIGIFEKPVQPGDFYKHQHA